jgi:hypothetical protein
LFHMTYVQDIPTLNPPAVLEQDQYRQLSVAINEAPAVELFREAGYQIYSSPSEFSDAALIDADVVLDENQLEWFDEVALRRSLGAGILQAVAPDFIPDQGRSRIEASFSHMEEIAGRQRQGPAFALIHVMAPHPPFLYAADGSPRRLPECFPGRCSLWEPQQDILGLDDAAFREGLQGQVAHVDEMILRAVDNVLARDDQSIIVLFGDHGTRYSEADPEEFYRIFLAAHTPQEEQVFPDEISVVDLMPRLLNALYGTHLPTHEYHAWRSLGLPLNLRQEH